ncbi:Crp/Fnr family transcriptional regulator [Microvirga antarctica]|uniref:Crp/Fnr family transcriptional regulator n=1 Tax=Microvirga antarctica TaxID=2819233 RepID=UPI001B314425|nr:helix-turn-helix domain-containing protein [Microvirga antarctica]
MYSSLAAPNRTDPGPAFSLVREGETLESLFAAQPSETFASGQAVFWEGDASSHLFQLTEGCLRLYRILSDGRRAVTGFVFPGESLGVSFQGPHLYTAEAVTPVRLNRLSLSRLYAAVDASVHLRQQLLARMYRDMSAAQHLIILLGQLSAEERVASFLLSAGRRSGADRSRPLTIDLPMSRLDIADYLGLTIETVCRVFSKFKRDGLIALEGRQRIVLRHPAALQALAGGGGEDSGEAKSVRLTARAH